MNHKRNVIIGATIVGAIAAASYLILKKIDYDKEIKRDEDLKRKNSPFKRKRKSKGSSTIPLNMFVTWYTKDLPPFMKLNHEQLKNDNPEFNHFLYDDDECREFIKTNYDSDVLDAFDKLIPGAYKADLWRCCVLYKLGGVYLDIKFKCINGFKFIALTDKEYFVRDRASSGNGVYNAIMVCKAGNSVLLQAIQRIVKNTQTEFYGENALQPTGPNMFREIIDKKTIDKLELYNDETGNNTHIVFRDTYVLEYYNEYFNERNAYQKTLYYGELWNKRQIYHTTNEIAFNRKNVPFQLKPMYDSVIPLNLFTAWHTKYLPPLMKLNYEQLKSDNPEFNHFLYDEAECREFIKTNFDQDLLYAFDKLIPSAYKADLWRCCVLYKLGGVYLDIKFKCINGFKFIALTDKEYLVRDRWNMGAANGLMICKAGNPILLKAINRIVKNTQNEFYGENPLHPTGPYLYKEFVDQESIDKLELAHEDHNGGITYISSNDVLILTPYPEYRDEQKIFQKVLHYDTLWHKRQIYKNT